MTSNKKPKTYPIGFDNWENARRRQGRDGRPEEYVDPFEDCDTKEKLFHIIGLILDGKLDPYISGDLPFVSGDFPLGLFEDKEDEDKKKPKPFWAKYKEKDLEVGNVEYGEWDAVRGKSLLYEDALKCVRKLGGTLRRQSNIRLGFEDMCSKTGRILAGMRRRQSSR